MSYTEKFTREIRIRGSKSVSFDYPASEQGGSKTVSVNYEHDETLYINVDVNTDQFDSNITGCKRSVDFLTGAVVATEAASVQAKYENAKRIGDALISGFFDTVDANLKQDIAELTKRTEATFVHLQQLAKDCTSMNRQMEVDYNRISGRYYKIFEDLNRELQNRIFDLDNSVFKFRKEVDVQKIRETGEFVGAVTVSNAENSSVLAKISASVIKERVFEMLQGIKSFLYQQNRLRSLVYQKMLNENVEKEFVLPLGYMETQSKEGLTSRSLYLPEVYRTAYEPYKVKFQEQFEAGNAKWEGFSEAKIQKIMLYFQQELGKLNGDDIREKRVKEMLNRIFRLESIKTIIAD